MAIGVKFVGAGLFVGALWDLFTTFYGVASYFDLPMNPRVNPEQFVFAVVVTVVVFGFVIATHIVWTMGDDAGVLPLLLKAAWAICVGIDLISSWEGTKYFVFSGDDSDAGEELRTRHCDGIDCVLDDIPVLADTRKDAKTKSHT